MRRDALIWKILYWLAVVVVSLALVVGLVLFLESRDESRLGEAEESGGRAAARATA